MADIMIVDDDDLIRDMVRSFLEDRGHMVSEAGDGREALLRLRDKPVDLAIIDVIMPNQEGLETIRKMRRDFPAISVIAISGGGSFGNRSYLEAAADFGAKGTLHKPFGPKDLLGMVDHLLAARSAA